MKKFGLGFLCAMTLVANAAFGAINLKELIDISGAVGDSMGNPLTQTMDYRVRFFDDATAGMQIGSDVLGSVTPETDGSFNIAVLPPATVTETSDSWYELALDTNGNGIDANDVFGQRVPIHAVPYAINSGSLNGMDSLEFATDLELAAGLSGRAATPHTHLLQDLGGAVTDSQVPDNITITEADTLDDVTGRGATTANAVTVGSVTATGQVAASSYVDIAQTAMAPSPATDRLYNNAGNLFWNGTQLDTGGGGGGTFRDILNPFYFTNSGQTTIAYLPWSGSNAEQPDLNTFRALTTFVAPFDGEFVSASLISDASLGNVDVSFHENFNATPIDTASIMGALDDTAYPLTFNTATFSAGDLLHVSVTASNPQSSGYVRLYVVAEYTVP